MIDIDFVVAATIVVACAIETCEMTFVVIFIIRGIVVVVIIIGEAVAEKLCAQIDRRLRLGVIYQVLFVLVVHHLDVFLVIVIICTIFSIHAQTEAEILKDGGHGCIEIGGRQHGL